MIKFFSCIYLYTISFHFIFFPFFNFFFSFKWFSVPNVYRDEKDKCMYIVFLSWVPFFIAFRGVLLCTCTNNREKSLHWLWCCSIVCMMAHCRTMAQFFAHNFFYRTLFLLLLLVLCWMAQKKRNRVRYSTCIWRVRVLHSEKREHWQNIHSNYLFGRLLILYFLFSFYMRRAARN